MEPSRSIGRLRAFACLAGLTASLTPLASSAAPLDQQQQRIVDPVILSGQQFPVLSVGPDPTFREPGAPGELQPLLPAPLQSECRKPGQNEWDPGDDGDHNCTQSSRLPHNPVEGAPVDRLLGYAWNGTSFEQIPFQVDERFTRYLSNNASGFGIYSWTDRHTSFAFEREGFRFTANDPNDVCKPMPRRDPVSGERIVAAADPVVGLDDDDELVFMARDAAGQAPPATPLPAGIELAFEVAVADPSNPTAPRFAYVMLAAADGPDAAFTAENSPYVHYQRDTGPNRLGADLFVFSESSYENYGAAPHGPICDPASGEPIRDANGNLVIKQRRPLDTAWITTPRYAFRYDGRWLMTQIRVSQGSDVSGFADVAADEIPGIYGPDLIDRWKARAFQQDPSSETPCCGYEEEDTNWGGSGILFGEKAGPVRVIRETWGADSSTNNIRREVFYRDLFTWGDHLRVHVIPPLDGIYSQWDYNAGKVTRYSNPTVPAGVPIDGRSDEVFGNLDDPCNTRYDGRGAELDQRYREAYKAAGLCDAVEYHQSIDISDPTISGVQSLQWEQVSGAFGSLVLRTTIKEHTPGGTAQSLLAVPYYRDDSCFDDGTGTDPGPRRRERSSTETLTYRLPSGEADLPRVCWTPEHGTPDEGFTAGVDERGLGDEIGDERYFQGSIGTSGTHILFIAESDNAAQTVPLTEIVSEQRVVVLQGDPGNVGEAYARTVEYPLVPTVRPFA